MEPLPGRRMHQPSPRPSLLRQGASSVTTIRHAEQHTNTTALFHSITDTHPFTANQHLRANLHRPTRRLLLPDLHVPLPHGNPIPRPQPRTRHRLLPFHRTGSLRCFFFLFSPYNPITNTNTNTNTNKLQNTIRSPTRRLLLPNLDDKLPLRHTVLRPQPRSGVRCPAGRAAGLRGGVHGEVYSCCGGLLLCHLDGAFVDGGGVLWVESRVGLWVVGGGYGGLCCWCCWWWWWWWVVIWIGLVGLCCVIFGRDVIRNGGGPIRAIYC